jgi:hypothetical protein
MRKLLRLSRSQLNTSLHHIVSLHHTIPVAIRFLASIFHSLRAVCYFRPHMRHSSPQIEAFWWLEANCPASLRSPESRRMASQNKNAKGSSHISIEVWDKLSETIVAGWWHFYDDRPDDPEPSFAIDQIVLEQDNLNVHFVSPWRMVIGEDD